MTRDAIPALIEHRRLFFPVPCPKCAFSRAFPVIFFIFSALLASWSHAVTASPSWWPSASIGEVSRRSPACSLSLHSLCLHSLTLPESLIDKETFCFSSFCPMFPWLFQFFSVVLAYSDKTRGSSILSIPFFQRVRSYSENAFLRLVSSKSLIFETELSFTVRGDCIQAEPRKKGRRREREEDIWNRSVLLHDLVRFFYSKISNKFFYFLLNSSVPNFQNNNHNVAFGAWRNSAIGCLTAHLDQLPRSEGPRPDGHVVRFSESSEQLWAEGRNTTADGGASKSEQAGEGVGEDGHCHEGEQTSDCFSFLKVTFRFQAEKVRMPEESCSLSDRTVWVYIVLAPISIRCAWFHVTSIDRTSSHRSKKCSTRTRMSLSCTPSRRLSCRSWSLNIPEWSSIFCSPDLLSKRFRTRRNSPRTCCWRIWIRKASDRSTVVESPSSCLNWSPDRRSSVLLSELLNFGQKTTESTRIQWDFSEVSLGPFSLLALASSTRTRVRRSWFRRCSSYSQRGRGRIQCFWKIWITREPTCRLSVTWSGIRDERIRIVSMSCQSSPRLSRSRTQLTTWPVRLLQSYKVKWRKLLRFVGTSPKGDPSGKRCSRKSTFSAAISTLLVISYHLKILF